MSALPTSHEYAGMATAERIRDDILSNETVSQRIRELRLQRSTYEAIVSTIKEEGLVSGINSKKVLISAVSSASRSLLGRALSKTIADENRHVVTSEDVGDAWKTGQAAATIAAAKLKGHYCEFQDDNNLRDVVRTCTNGHGVAWADVAWIMEHQHGVKANAKGCRMRYYKIKEEFVEN